MVFVGDLYQLPPVVAGDEREIFRTVYETPYFFSARALAATASWSPSGGWCRSKGFRASSSRECSGSRT